MTHPRHAGRLAPAGSMLAGLHTIVTADLAELRQALTTHTAGTA